MITEIKIYIGSDEPPDDASLRLLMADICDILVLNGGGNVLESSMPANSVVITKFLDIDPQDSEQFLADALLDSVMAVVPVQTNPEEKE